jgi:diguanylate cyclase (GGDEF)-like protein
MSETKTKVLVVDDDARLRDLLNRYLGEQGYSVTASVGIVTMASNSATSEMLDQADSAMYRAKQNGRNGISF